MSYGDNYLSILQILQLAESTFDKPISCFIDFRYSIAIFEKCIIELLSLLYVNVYKTHFYFNLFLTISCYIILF